MPHVDQEVLRLAEVVYEYHQLRHAPQPADAMLVFGTNDLRVADAAAALFHRGFSRIVVCSGGVAHADDLLSTGWTNPEAEVFADTMVARGVPRAAILLEPRALNTAENVRFTRELLHSQNLAPRNLLLVMKPFMQRRVWATMAVEWPEMPATVASPDLTLDQYFTAALPSERVIPILLGDLQRLWIYARNGWSAPQRLPAPVLDAYRELAARGFTQHLIPNQPDPA
ncbi:MAG: YdcF family protein [Acidobacteria bacterium]|nr:YdcF family protein [Acidobacteriota bacterium]